MSNAVPHLAEAAAQPVQIDAPTAHEIWTTLSAINVNDQIKKKGGLSYLSWPFAVGAVKDAFPDFRYTFLDNEVHADGTVTTHVACGIGDVWNTMDLPVMDNRNNAIKNPDARAISDSKMRCLVKGIAMLGLGLYIYAGEDLPQTKDATPEPEKKELSSEGKAKLEAVALTLNTFIEEVTNRDELKAYWTDNKAALKELSNDAEDLYAEVLKNFKAKGAAIAEASEGK